MNNEFDELIDKDIQDEISNMTPRQKAGELAVIETEMQQEKNKASLEQESVEIEAIWKSAKVGTVLSLTEQNTLDNLIKVGSDPDKATKWITSLRGSGINSSDFNPRKAVEGHHLYPDKVYQQEATKQLKDDYIRGVVTNNPELPIDLIKQMSYATTKAEVSMLFAKYGTDLKEAIVDEVNGYLLQQSQATDLPRKLRAKISGLSAKNLEEARSKVKTAIRDYKGGY